MDRLLRKQFFAGTDLLYAQKDDQAIAKFKEVAAKYQERRSFGAVSTARLVYMDNGKVNEYAAWVKTLDFVEVSDAIWIMTPMKLQKNNICKITQNRLSQFDVMFLNFQMEFMP